MLYMNDYDLQYAVDRFTAAGTRNRLALTLVVINLAVATDRVSDGWAYWSTPRRAAQKAIALIESRTGRENDEQERVDATRAEMATALRPIKSMLTKHRETFGTYGDTVRAVIEQVSA